jgi:hypothetical protein
MDLHSIFAKFRQTYWGDLLYRGMKYSLVAYYVFLTLYCIISAVLGSDRISYLAILPQIYSFLCPMVILIVTQFIGYIAAFMYRRKQFRFDGCGFIITLIFGAYGFAILWFSGLYKFVEQPFFFQRVDFIFITLSLWDICVRLLFAEYRGILDERLAYRWLKRLYASAEQGIILQVCVVMLTMIVAGIFKSIYKNFDVWIGLLWLSLIYLSNAYLRWSFIPSPASSVSPRKPLREEKSMEHLPDCYDEFGIKQEKGNKDENVDQVDLHKS